MNQRTTAIIISCYFTLFIGFSIRYAYGLLLPEMLPSLDITKARAGVIYASYFITYTVCSPVFGLLADRYSIRFILAFCVALLGTGACLMAYSTSVLSAGLFFSIVGVGHAACWVSVVALIQRWVSDRRRGTALALVDTGSATGIAVWGFILPVIVNSHGWKAGWSSLGVFGVAVGLMNLLMIRNRPKEASGERCQRSAQNPHAPMRDTYRAIFVNPLFWLFGISYLLLGFTILIPFTFLSLYAVQELKTTYAAATRLVAIIAIAGVCGKLFLSHLSDRFGRMPIMMICTMLVSAGSLGMGCITGYTGLIGMTLVFGFGYGAIWPVYAASTVDYFSKNTAGSVLGLWAVLLGIGSILSPVTAGWVIDSTGRFYTAFILSALSSGAALALLALAARSNFRAMPPPVENKGA